MKLLKIKGKWLKSIAKFNIVFACIAGGIGIHANSSLGYTAEFQVGLSYTTKSTDTTGTSATVSGPAADVRLNWSTIGLLFFKDSPFMVGDHLGFGIGGGYFSRTNGDSTVMMPINFEGGLKAAYAINADLEVGVKWVYYGANQFADYKNDFYVAAKNAFAASARYKNFMASLGVGAAKMDNNHKFTAGNPSTGTYFMAEGRYFFDNVYLLARVEIYGGKNELYGVTRNDSASQYTFGIGWM